MFRTEDEFVRWLRCQVAWPGRGLRLGIGDDAALVSVGQGQELILTSDMSIEGVHFRRNLHPPRSVGHRALARALSDIAAMGGRPRFALVSLAVSSRVSSSWVKAFYHGMLRLANRLGVAIIGGDTAVVPDRITVDAIVVGEVPHGQALRRSGARPGDHIFVSGRLGLAALGLYLLESGSTSGAAWARTALRAHLWPEPQCALGRFLAGRHLATAMMDISDGLSTDLARFCQASGVGARLWESEIPVLGTVVAAVSPIAGVRWTPSQSTYRTPPSRLAQTLPFRSAKAVNSRFGSTVGSSPPKTKPDGQKGADRGYLLNLALHGGEDYQLLFTVPARQASAIPAKFRSVPLHRIGEIQKGKRILLVRASGREEPLPPAGYNHFQKVQ